MDSFHRTLGAVSTPAVSGLSLLFGRGGADPAKRDGCAGIKKHVPASEATTTAPSVAAPDGDGCDAIALRSVKGAAALAKMSLQDRGDLARRCAAAAASVAPVVAASSVARKGSYEPGIGEDLALWSTVGGYLQELSETLGGGGGGSLPVRFDAGDGRHKVSVFPRGMYLHVMFSGYSAELWFKDGPPAVADPTEDDGKPGAWFVLGAGNQACMVAGDVAHVVFSKGRAVVCKLNPVNDYLLPYLNAAFAPLVEKDIVQFFCGNVENSSYFVRDERIRGIHLTGSDKTYDAIQFGPDVAQNKAAGRRNITKPFMSELGCCTPYIVCPGAWSADAIEFHARAVVSAVVNNAHHNCNAVQNLVTPACWAQREEFMDAVCKHLDAAQRRHQYYPGAQETVQEFERQAEGCRIVKCGRPTAGADLPAWVVIRDVPPGSAACRHTCRNEAFAGVLTEIVLPAADATAFLAEAVGFCNDEMAGTLSCSLFLPPDLEATEPAACAAAVAGLRYGSVCVNVPSLFGFALTCTTWGGYPGHTPENIGSGIGQAHNSSMYVDVEKSVVRGPWRSPITPVWFSDNTNAEKFSGAVVDFLANPSFFNFTMAAMAGVQG